MKKLAFIILLFITATVSAQGPWSDHYDTLTIAEIEAERNRIEFLSTTDNGTYVVLLSKLDSLYITKVGTPVDNQIGVWTGDGTIEGNSGFEWDGSYLMVPEIRGDGTGTGGSVLLGATNFLPNGAVAVQFGNTSSPLSGVYSLNFYPGGVNSGIKISRDVSNNMTFTDPVTGSKTLAELAAGGGGGSLPDPFDIDSVAFNSPNLEFYFDGDTSTVTRNQDALDILNLYFKMSGENYLQLTPATGATETEGRIYYDSDDDTPYVWNGTEWVDLGGSGGESPDSSFVEITTDTIRALNDNTVAIAADDTLTGRVHPTNTKELTLSSVSHVAYYNKQDHTWLRFSDSTITVSATQDTWYQVTNSYDSLFAVKDLYSPHDSLEISADTVIAHTNDHYNVTGSLSLYGTASDDLEARLVISDAGGTPIEISKRYVSTNGTDPLSISFDTYWEAGDGDRLWMEVRNTASNDDFTIVEGHLKIQFYHYED